MLPDSKDFSVVENPLKLADTGIEIFYKIIIDAGATKKDIVCKFAGGSQLYKNKSNAKMFDLGDLNIIKVKEILKSMNIPILAEDLGGNSSRTIDFDVQNKCLTLRKIDQFGIHNIDL